MNDFSYLATAHRDHRGVDDLVVLSLKLSTTPCGPLYKRHVSPNRELAALVATWMTERASSIGGPVRAQSGPST